MQQWRQLSKMEFLTSAKIMDIIVAGAPGTKSNFFHALVSKSNIDFID
jgi:hypothetical protein